VVFVQTTEKISWTSRGWLGFFAIIYAVLLVIGAVAFSFMVTVGSTQFTSRVITTKPAITAISKDINQSLNQTVKKAGVALPANTRLMPDATIKDLVRVGLDADQLSSMPKHVTTASNEVKARIRQASGKPVPAKLAATIDKEVKSGVYDYIEGSFGGIYPFIVLVTQTGTIVAGILILFVFLFMAVASKTWWRWLLVVGRTTYIVGFLGGIAAMVIAWPPVISRIFPNTAPPALVFQRIVIDGSPTWQRVAGVVIIIGLVLAAISYLVRRKELIKA